MLLGMNSEIEYLRRPPEMETLGEAELVSGQYCYFGILIDGDVSMSISIPHMYNCTSTENH